MTAVAEKIVAAKPVFTRKPSLKDKVRHHDAALPGDAAHQGDLIFVVLDKMPKGVVESTSRQLAQGDTMGSRHIVKGGEVFDVDSEDVAAQILALSNGKCNIDPRYIGKVFVGPCVVEHPQHEHHAYRENTVVAVVFQRNMDAEEREIRARD